jgi:hypothetical protein
MKAEAQTAADAAALAGAGQIKQHIVAQLAAQGLVRRDQIGLPLVMTALGTRPALTGETETAEGDYANRNGGHITAAVRPAAFDTMVEVATNEALDSQAASVHSDGKRASAQSRARVGVTFLPLPPIPPPPAAPPPPPPQIIFVAFFGVIVLPPPPQPPPPPPPPPPPLNPLDYIRFTVRLVPLGG